MNENRYTRTVDSIKAPEESVQKMLDTVHSYEKKEKIIYMSTMKKTVIAASLAIALVLGAVFGIPALSQKSYPFTLTVNAAEISDKEFTTVGTLDTNGSLCNIDKESKNGFFTEFFEFNVQVENENIERVLYTVEGGDFGLNSNDTAAYTKALYQSGIVTSEMHDTDYTCLHISAYTDDPTLPSEVRQAILDWYDYTNTMLNQPPLQDDYDDSKFNVADCRKTIYDAMFDRLVIDVAVTFIDGTEVHKTLVFACDSVEDETGIAAFSAKLI